MSDENEIEFEGGFFGDAGVNVADVPDDPFGFGNEPWPLVVTEVAKPKVTGNKDKIGMMVTFAVDHPKYQGHQVSKQLGFGNWFQLPVPKALQNQIPWDPQNNPKDMEAMVKLRRLFISLGFGVDELSGVNGEKMVGRRCMAKIFPKENEQGFWQFNLNGFKPIGEGNGNSGWGNNEFASGTTSNPGGGKSAAELLEDEMNES